MIWRRNKIGERICLILLVKNIASTSFWRKCGSYSIRIREKDNKQKHLIWKWINFIAKIFLKKHFSPGERKIILIQTYLQRRIWKHSKEIDWERHYKHSLTISKHNWHPWDENRVNRRDYKGQKSSKRIICFCFE